MKFVPVPHMALVLTLAGTACSGSIGSSGTTAPAATETEMAPPPPRRRPDAGATPAAPPPIVGREQVPACKVVEPGPNLARRLTRWEYTNTVRDLIGDKLDVARAFPPEERKLGFDNNATVSTVSPLLSEQFMLAAESLASQAIEGDLARFMGCDAATLGTQGCFDRFVGSFARKAYRRPATDEELKILRDLFAFGQTTGDFKTGVKLTLMAMLQSPQFLYRIEQGQPPRAGDKVTRLTAHETASRLSYLVWGSPPDATLRTAAEQNKLGTPDEIEAQLTRMLVEGAAGAQVPHRRARESVLHFYGQWLELEKLQDLEKDTKVYPAFNKALLSLMKIETESFVTDVFFSPTATLATLFTGAYTFADRRLAGHYGPEVTMPPAPAMGTAPTFERTMVDPGRRSGILTQGALLALHANANQTSPVLRGKFVREQLLCQLLPPPPNDVMIVLPMLDPNLTTRERFDQHARDPRCAGCHRLMDPIGLGFERYDAVGKYRERESGKVVDESGEVAGMSDGKFSGPVELGRKLAASPEVAECVVRQWFRYAYGREEVDGVDDCSLALIKGRFAAGGYTFRALLSALVTSDTFLYKRVDETGGTP